MLSLYNLLCGDGIFDIIKELTDNAADNRGRVFI